MQNEIIEEYLDYANNYLSVELFAEHRQISVELAQLLIKEGRILYQLKTNNFRLDTLDKTDQAYFESNMLY